MKVKTVLINWHDKLPIFSVDFDHNYTDSKGGGWRFATGGGDNNVRIWRLRTPREREADPHQPMVEFLASLNRHTAPVNVVRFSPCSSRLASAGDDGVVIIWRQVEGSEEDSAQGKRVAAVSVSGNLIGDSDDHFIEPETWRPMALLRGSLADICDLAWSPDGRFLVSASVDNTARIWDVADARCVQVLVDHSHYVQGVAWDPLGEFIATQSSDRSLRVYKWIGPKTPRDIKPGMDVVALGASHYTMSVPVAEQSAAAENDSGSDAEGSKMDVEDSTAPTHRSQRLFHDDNLASFFRRPSISPDGRLLATAAGVQRSRASRNTCYVWPRDGLAGPPVLSLSGHQKPVVATRWAPCEFEALAAAGDAQTGWLAPPSDCEKSTTRMMLAVGSQGAVALYDTSVAGRAVGLVGGLHYAAITDLAWTGDGSHLVIASLDGFASVATLDQPSTALGVKRCVAKNISETADARSGAKQDCVQSGHPPPTEAQPAETKGKKRLAPTFVGTI
ncbi:Chromatin assembly factor 1 subunit [Coemansia sp. RSA 1813]|nr:Chromatin assembly factor 1 subunit [Coemansia sp. RSA 1646]KAJ1768195.1 Chromatin assembly factor 1 subunit [Coemansia sp. RSA 1843]KAJ2086445.1 Chromatin assembly factor 1 subunit [Coemansia sp. RSA 986]KAJ2211103.1 Chromatin assembly factor 1 subunit [Coemansia sp. RSA 487]KAJ2564533.1 Chromatin assembly factor 1 subunit [Coemansia sp. RSA 1813]